MFKPCVADGCDYHADTKGLCLAHYRIAKRDGITRPLLAHERRPRCDFEGCERQSATVQPGLCMAHRSQAARRDDPRPLRTLRTQLPRDCAFNECDNPSSAKGLCSGHYQQRRAGKDLTPLRPRAHPLAKPEDILF